MHANGYARNASVELYCFCVVALGLILYGYPVGVTNVMLTSPAQFQRDAGFEGDVETLGMLVSANSAGALIGCALTLVPTRGVAAADALGRVALVKLGAGCYAAASLAMALTPMKLNEIFGSRAVIRWFAACRLLYGIGMTLTYGGAAVYVAELMSQQTRGYYLPMMSVMTMTGDLLGNFVGMPLERAAGGWRVLAALPVPVALAFYAYARKLPDSPRWEVLNATNAAQREGEARRRAAAEKKRGKRGLFGRGRDSNAPSDSESENEPSWTTRDVDLTAARRSLGILRNESAKASFSVTDACVRRSRSGGAGGLLAPSNPDAQSKQMKKEIEQELAEIIDVVKTGSKNGRDCASAVNTDASKRAMTVAFGLSIMSMLSGVPAMSYFTKHIFEMTGHTPTAASGMTTALALCKLIVTIFVAMSLETFGRRRMLLIGISIQGVAMTLLAFLFDGVTWIEDPRHAVSFQLLNGSIAQVADVAIFVNAVGFHLSFWALAWTVANELSPLRTRATIMAINSMFSWTLSTVTVRFLPVMMKSPGISATFGFCAVNLCATIIFVYLYVPETKGRTLEELEIVMTKSSSLRDVVRRLNRPDEDDDLKPLAGAL